MVTAPVRALLAFECERARDSSSARRPGAAACGGAPAGRRRDHGRHLLEILRRIERSGYDVFPR